MENDYCLPKIISVTPLKDSRVRNFLQNVRVALVPLKTVHRRGNILWQCLSAQLPTLQKGLPGLACCKAGVKKHLDVKSLGDISTKISWKEAPQVYRWIFCYSFRSLNCPLQSAREKLEVPCAFPKLPHTQRHW